MSENLKAFLSEWLTWVEAGAMDNDVFERFCGLCSSFKWHMRSKGISECDCESEVACLKDLFKSEGLDEEYPFGGQDVYMEEGLDETAHLNLARIDWVRSKVAQHEVA